MNRNDILTERLVAATAGHLRTNDPISHDAISRGTTFEQKSPFKQGSSDPNLAQVEKNLNSSFPSTGFPNAHINSLIITDDGSFACPKCPRMFETRSRAFEHLLDYRHNYICPEQNCSWSFQQQHEMQQHDELHKNISRLGKSDLDPEHCSSQWVQALEYSNLKSRTLEDQAHPTREQIGWSPGHFTPHERDPVACLEGAAVPPVNQHLGSTFSGDGELVMKRAVLGLFDFAPPQAVDLGPNGSVAEDLGETQSSGHGYLPSFTDGNRGIREGIENSQLVPFVFKWEYPATEVFVTGTFDNWSKTILLDKAGDLFAKEVLLPLPTENIYYKFAVDGYWMANHTAPMESDNAGNLNNVITPIQLAVALEARCTLGTDGYNLKPGPYPLAGFVDNLEREMIAKANSAITQGEKLPPHSNDDQDWDLKSLGSLDTFRDSALGSILPSDVSVSITNGLPRTAQEEILIIIISDAEVRSLFEEAARRIDKPRFIRNVRRLLLLFHCDLSVSGLDPRELDALRIIQKHTQWLASRTFDLCNPDSSLNTNVFATHLNQQLDKRPMLENYLASIASMSKSDQKSPMEGMTLQSTATTDHAQTQLEENDYSSEEDPEESQNGAPHIDYSMFPNLERIKNFIVGGAAFEKLRRYASQWIRPVQRFIPDPREAPTQTPALSTENIRLSSPSPDAFSQKSSTESGTTDVTVPDIASDSDDDDSDLSSDPDLYDGTSEDRILDPKSYFNNLRSLEQEVFDNSGLSAYKEGGSFSKADDDRFICGSNATESPPAAYVDVDFGLSLIKSTTSGNLLRLLECYDLMVRIRRSLRRLQETGYCTGHISIIVQDVDRTGVAKLIQIEIEAILRLGIALEKLLRNVIFIVSAMPPNSPNQDVTNSAIEKQDDQIGVTSNCLRILSSMDFSTYLLLNDSRPIIWECTFQCLDLAVLSYAGAHIKRFDLDHVGTDISSFEIPRRFVYHDQTLRELCSSPVPSVIIMRRRQFQCLDKFLGEAQPWVFHQDFCNLGSQRLCLSTTIGALSDIWGPSWKIIRDTEPEHIQQVDIGNGAILPWSILTDRSEPKVETRPSEVFCHWISFKNWDNAEIEGNLSCLPRPYFVESDVLLVGAESDFGLVHNPNCLPSTERLLSIKTNLEQEGALRTPNTFRTRRYVDSHAVQVQGSAMGFISASGTVTYKRQIGQTMKGALVERWKHNLRNPMDLEAFSGVEISLCTRNARRRRLLHLLGSPTMHNYLRGISFNWISEASEYAYLKALRSPKHFRRFWNGLTPDHLDNVGDAISKCLDALEETGIDDDSRELRGLWVESFDTEGDSDGESDNGSDDYDKLTAPTAPPYTAVTQAHTNFFEEWVVTLFKSEHTWTGFLEDSEESLTMAILGTACLDFDHGGYGRRCCQSQVKPASSTKAITGYPALQTSLQINSSLLNDSKLKLELVSKRQTTVWNAKELKKGTTFCLGNHGSLKVLTAAARTCPVIMEWSGVKSETVKEVKNISINEKLLGRPKEKHHREYIRGKWEEKPLPVLVLSKSNKVLFSK
ncbi:hypothetical protein IFR05_012832 [Cadophora sp. M221]|nr:hypothetical protein IFR05_012832 [Cadophora sp. M221]